MSERERNMDKPPAPAASTDGDNFGDARMGMVKVAYNPTAPGLPNCDEIVGSIKQLGVNNQEMVHKMDNFAHTNFGSRGVTLADLNAMKNNNQFNADEKKVLGFMIDGFAKNSGDFGDPSRLTVREFLNYLIKAATDQRCNFPGMQQAPPQGGGIRRKS